MDDSIPIPPRPPEGKGRRFVTDSTGIFSEDADLNITEFVEFLLNTAFENESALHEMLGDYSLVRRKSIEDIYINMTCILDVRPLRAKLGLGREIDDNMWRARLKLWAHAAAAHHKTVVIEGRSIPIGENDILFRPASGIDPEVCAMITLQMIDGAAYTLHIVRVYNAMKKFSYEYIMDKVPSEHTDN